jgi:hypothetical protein
VEQAVKFHQSEKLAQQVPAGSKELTCLHKQIATSLCTSPASLPSPGLSPMAHTHHRVMELGDSSLQMALLNALAPGGRTAMKSCQETTREVRPANSCPQPLKKNHRPQSVFRHVVRVSERRGPGRAQDSENVPVEWTRMRGAPMPRWFQAAEDNIFHVMLSPRACS